MKIKPIVNQMAQFLPQLSNKFTDVSTVSSASATGGIATIVTAVAHNLSIGQSVVMSGVVQQIVIDSLTLDSATNQVTARTSVDHGLTETFNFKTHKTTDITVEISGVAEAEYNGTFELVRVPNRFAFIYQLPATPGSPPTGTGIVANYTLNVFNGAKTVLTVPNTTTFTFAVSSTDVISTFDTGSVHSNFRITGAINLDRILESYTKQLPNEWWLFIAPNSSVASKNREILNDSVTTYRQNHQTFRQRLIETLDMFVLVPTSDEISARNAIDELEDVKVAIFQSFLRFPASIQYDADSGDGDQFVYWYNSSSIAAYNTAFLVFQYTFETNYDVTYFDTFIAAFFSPFRDIDLTQSINDGEWSAEINLDVDPDF